MTLLPDETFMQCMYLIPDTRHEDGTVAQLNNLAELLQSGNFAQFWELAAEPELRSTLDSFATFDKSIRECKTRALGAPPLCRLVPQPDRAPALSPAAAVAQP